MTDTITFEAYAGLNASMHLHRAPRVRSTAYDASQFPGGIDGAFLLHRAPRVRMTASTTDRASMLLRHPAPQVRFVAHDTAQFPGGIDGVFLLHRTPQVALSGGVPVPSASVFVLNSRGPRVKMQARVIDHATMHLHRQPRVLLGGPGARFMLRRAPHVYLYDGHVSMDRTAFLLQQPVLSGYVVEGQTVAIADRVRFADATAVVRRIQQLISGLGFAGNATIVTELLLRLNDRIGLDSVVDAMLRMRLDDTVGVGGQLAPSEYALLALVDALSIAADPGHTQETTRLLAALLALSDTLDHPTRERLLAAIGVTSLLHADAIAYARALDALRLTAVATGDLLLSIVLRDEVALTGSTTNIAEVLLALRSSFGAVATLALADEAYTAWVFDPDSKGVWGYDNFPFNSFAKVGDQYLAAGPDGIYELTGNKDDDADIQWRIRTGLLNFGTQLQKRVDVAYLGYTSDGTVGMSVVATSSPEGEKTQYNYKMRTINAGAPTENRIKLSKGLKSVYYAFELVGTGAFELHDLQILPMTLERRV